MRNFLAGVIPNRMERAGNNFLISSWQFGEVSRPRRLLDRRSTAMHTFNISLKYF